MTSYNYRIPIDRLKTAQAVIKELESLEPRLSSSELLPVSFFNRAYLIITRRINQAKLTGLFEDPSLMDELEVAFAARYFAALNYYVDHGELPQAWAKINQTRWHHKHPASLSLMLGANAHINYDLPVALKTVIVNPEKFQTDYFKVNKLLQASGRDISKSYYESDKSINFLKKNLRALYLRPTMWLILRWRTRAWDKLGPT